MFRQSVRVARECKLWPEVGGSSALQEMKNATCMGTDTYVGIRAHGLYHAFSLFIIVGSSCRVQDACCAALSITYSVPGTCSAV